MLLVFFRGWGWDERMKHFIKYLLYVNIHVMGVFNTLYSVAYLFQYITRDVIVCCFDAILFLSLFIITYYNFCMINFVFSFCFVCLFVCLFICLLCLFVCLFVCLLGFFSLFFFFVFLYLFFFSFFFFFFVVLGFVVRWWGRVKHYSI